MDTISRLFNDFFDWAGALAPVHLNFLLRALLVFGLPCLFCGWAFVRGNRSVMVQTLCFVTSVLLAATIPVERLTVSNRELRAWVITFAVVLLVFLPGILPTLIVPELGAQKKARLICYLTLIALFLVNVIQHW